MSLLAVEILLAALAIKRGWRLAPLLWVAVPFAAAGAAPVLAPAFAPWIGDYFDPAATVHALSHAFALLGLAVACWAGPAGLPSGRRVAHAEAPLYQI
ncbi:MAG: hypothetical protein ABFS41_10450 [Myxococcota bacterium]